jgi:hypothetical protein
VCRPQKMYDGLPSPSMGRRPIWNSVRLRPSTEHEGSDGAFDGLGSPSYSKKTGNSTLARLEGSGEVRATDPVVSDYLSFLQPMISGRSSFAGNELEVGIRIGFVKDSVLHCEIGDA